MFCPYCRQELPEDALFCNRCGRSLQAPQAMQLEQSPVGTDTSDTLSQMPPPIANTALPGQSGILPPAYPQQSGMLPPAYPQQSGPIMPTFAQPGPFTPTTVPQALPPPSAMQRWLIRMFQPALASNPVFGVMLGSLVAIIGGLTVTAIILAIAHATTPSAGHYFYGSDGEQAIGYVLGIIPLHMFWRDTLQLFLIAQGAGLHIQFGTSNNTSGYAYVAPLSGFLIVPALFLILGGYIAASTDLQNRVRVSFLRGGAIAIPYTLILLLLSSQVNGPISQTAGTSSSDSLVMDTITLIVWGFFWGVFFGLLGASLKLARGQWRHKLRQYLQRSTRPQIAGAVAGACLSSGLGLALSYLALCGFMAFTTLSIPLLAQNQCISGSWQFLTFWSIAQGPIHAVNLFFFLLGSPITIHSVSSGSGCFYSALPQTSLTWRNAGLHLPLWAYVLLLIPAVSLFLGGRTSVAISRVRGVGPAAVQGLLIALPFTLIMVLLTLVSTITNTFSQTTTILSIPTSRVQSAGVGFVDLLLWALLTGALFGMLGGIYEVSIKNTVQQALMAIITVLTFPIRPLFWLLDRLSGQSAMVRRSSSRSLLYGAFLVSILLAIVVAIAGIVLIATNQIMTIDTNRLLQNSVSVLLVTLPGLLLLVTCMVALCRDPVVESADSPPTQ